MTDIKLFSGRPEDERIAKELRCYDFLDSLNIEYTRADHEHGDTMEALLQVETALDCRICKNLLLTNRQMTDIYLLMMPGDKPFKTKLLSKQIGSARLSFASPEQMEENLDITPGSLSVLGLMNDKANKVRLLMDAELLQQEYIGCHPCINSSTLKLRTCDIMEKILPAVSHEASIVELPWEVE